MNDEFIDAASMSKDLQETILIRESVNHYKAKRYLEALNAYETVIQLDPKCVAAYVGKGDCLRKRGQLLHALYIYDRAISIDSTNVAAYNGKCYAYIKLRMLEDALSEHERAIKLEPQNATAHNCKGQILKLQGRYKEALEAFEKAIHWATKTDNSAGYYYNKGLVLTHLSRYEDALHAYEQAHQYDPENIKYSNAISSVQKNRNTKPTHYFEDGKYYTEEVGYDNLLPSVVHVEVHELESKGHVFFKLNRFAEALRAYDDAIDLRTKDVHCYINLGTILVRFHHYEEASYRFTQALRLDPQNISTYIVNGKTLLKLMRYEEALQIFEKTLQLSPDCALAYSGRGHALFALNRHIEALKAYGEAIFLHVEDADCYCHAGDILSGLRFLEEAIQVYRLAIHYDPQLILAYLGLGSALFDLKQYAEALIAYFQILWLNEKNDVALAKVREVVTELYQYYGAFNVYEKAFDRVWSEQSFDKSWFFTTTLCILECPIPIQFMLIKHCMIHAPVNFSIREALAYISNHYDELFNINSVSPKEFFPYLNALHSILLHIDEKERAEALTLIACGEDIRIAQLLVYFAPFALTGLTSLAHQVTVGLAPALRDDSLIIRFCKTLDTYGVPYVASKWLFAQQLMLEEQYSQAKLVLSDLVKCQPSPDYLWQLVTAMRRCQDSAREQIVMLHQFIEASSPSEMRTGEAWMQIGDLSDGINAIEAYEQAEAYGLSLPRLQAYRSGDWDALGSLRRSSNYNFPVVVVLDIECDYQPDAPFGSGVFEIAAVRFKGDTKLDHCHAVIKRDFISPKVQHLQEEAVEPEVAIRHLQAFIGTSIVVGHNLQAFDAKHLCGMGLVIGDEQMIDTLTFARWLYPDSIHHNLSLLCQTYNIQFQGEHHTALPDAHACGRLLYALGDELVRRGERLIAGFRALTPPGSALDRAVLQPRGIAADPTFMWSLDPAPTPSHLLTSVLPQAPASPGVLHALEKKVDALVERYDPSAGYTKYLPTQQRVVVLVDSHNRLERMLAHVQKEINPFTLPSPRTLLCPDLLRQSIEHAQGWEMKLTLFCLYQASHNHDARTLYPLRLSTDDSDWSQLPQILLSACCANHHPHSDTCAGHLLTRVAIEQYRVLFATHESFLQQLYRPEADIMVIDDIDMLQMHFAEYLAEGVTSEQVRLGSQEAYNLLNKQISRYVREGMSDPGLYERIPLRRMIPYLINPLDGNDKGVLTILKESGESTSEIATTLEAFCSQASLEELPWCKLHAYWLDLRAIRQTDNSSWSLEQWSIYGLSENIQQTFHRLFWEPYKQHILCGTAISLGAQGTTFLTRFFDLPMDLWFHADERPPSRIYIPSPEIMRPASLMGRRSWAKSVGTFLFQLAATDQRSVVVSLQPPSIAHALADTFLSRQHDRGGRQVLSPRLGWTTAKIIERLTDTGRKTMAFVSPRLRKSALHVPVNIEATGPLRFLNQQDPLVIAHMRLFAQLDPKDNPFGSYLLPQALLELKARLSSPANVHVILDSGLHSKIYRDEVNALLKQDTLLESLPGVSSEPHVDTDAFVDVLDGALERWGLSSRTHVDDETLHIALQTFLKKERFRNAPLNQKEIVQTVFDSKDQLVIAATGGGKSLCFQLPAILMAQDTVPKVTLVISPLIALMKDQVEVLQNKGVFSAIFWNKTLSSSQRRAYLEGIKRGWYSIIYIAPEQIHSSALRKALDRREIGLIAIDEAHCVSQWGHNFRTNYFALRDWIETRLCAGNRRIFPLIALTATARYGYKDPATGIVEQGTVQDIVANLGLQIGEKEARIPSLERPELELSVKHIEVQCSHCRTSLGMKMGRIKCFSCGQWCDVEEDDVEVAKLEQLITLLSAHREQGVRQRWERPYGQRQRGLIYCAYTKTTEVIADLLSVNPRLAGLRVAAYHGQMTEDKKNRVYSSFICDDEDGLDIVVATNAFGMGIDVRRLGFVIHFDVPGTLEAYVQEAGRAGRDDEFREGRESAQCILLYHEHDLGKQRYLNEINRITEQEIVDVYKAFNRCRTPGKQEIFVTEREIELLKPKLSQEDNPKPRKEGNKLETILYYLQYHTYANERPVLKRGENTTVQLLLAFEHGYTERMENAALSASSRQLVALFLASDDFRLREREVRIIDDNDLADSLGWGKIQLLEEIGNLVRRQILVRAHCLFIRCTKSKAEASEFISQLEQDVIKFLIKIPNQTALRSGQYVDVDIEALYNQEKLQTPFPMFTRFLFAISNAYDSPLQLFRFFERLTSGCHKIQLIPIEQVKTKRESIFQSLRQVVQRYAPSELADDWQVLDMLAQEPDHEQRYQLDQHLLLLKELGLLIQESFQTNESAMHIFFKQKDISASQLKIDLSQLRLVERYGERKLELMKEYATAPNGQRKLMLNSYFVGEIPLLYPFEMRPGLTEQQQDLIRIEEGYHLVTGPAGSGKTTVLEEHVRYLVECKLVPADHILVVAHYKSAVDRISRTVNVYQQNGKHIQAMPLNSLGMSIFLSHREMLLRPEGQPYYAEKAELRTLSGTWSVIEEQEHRLLQETLASMRQEGLYDRPRLKRNGEDCLDSIKRLRQQGIFPNQQCDEATRRFLSKRIEEDRVAFIYEVYSRYLILLGEKGLYTYDDQILFALTILRKYPHIASDYQQRYEHIIIDEYQDLMPAQAELIDILSLKHRSVMAFGDTEQDIRIKAIPVQTPTLPAKSGYKIPCGKPGVIKDLEDFEDDSPYSPNDTPKRLSPLIRNSQLVSDNKFLEHHLVTNFRSVQEILNLANAIRNDTSVVTQVAAKGFKGSKPTIIRVNISTTSSTKNDHRTMIRTMVDASLHRLSLLPPTDTNSVALMVAKAEFSRDVQDYLTTQQVGFALLGRNHYQSWHVRRVLTYYRLIADRHQDAEVEQLLRSCVVPCLDFRQISRLKKHAQEHELPLIDLVTDSEILEHLDISLDQQEALKQHLAIIDTFCAARLFGDVWQAISELEGGPLAMDESEGQQQEDLENVLAEFEEKTVTEALEYISRHITFLEKRHPTQQLIVTTIDHAKSQAFDTVFLLGAHLLKQTQRQYVSVSRAKECIFFLVNGQPSEDEANITWLPRELCDEFCWP